MIRYECDKCGTSLTANDAGRYIVKLEVFAAAGHIELDESSPTDGSELSDLIEELRHADPDEIEDQTYRCFRFDLCDRCRRRLMKKPLG